MTAGSPVASFVSGPGTVDTNAICLESGDQSMAAPSNVSGEFVSIISVRKRLPVPSAFAT